MHAEETKEFSDWINGLRDVVGRARIQARIERLRQGNPGDHSTLRGGVKELKMDFGPGYRVYYIERGKTVIVLLGGGDKSTQRADIEAAVAMAEQL